MIYLLLSIINQNLKFFLSSAKGGLICFLAHPGVREFSSEDNGLQSNEKEVLNAVFPLFS